jgi:GTP-binding protein
MNQTEMDVPETNSSLPRAEAPTRLPVVALVGRPNTGKSTLFNRLTRSRRAVVASTPGVTRDRNIAPAEYGGRRFLVVDTGGFEADEKEEMASAVRGQSLLAAEEADAIVVVMDARGGLSPLDEALFNRLRRYRKPLFVAVNKVDTPAHERLVGEFHALGADALFPVSAEHGLNVSALMDAVVAELPPVQDVAALRGAIAVAIVGRPNVGKSSLLNRLVGYERAIVTPLPGTTRDAIDTPVSRSGRNYLLVDTAGVRRRSRVQAHVERASVVRALRALERAEVGLVVVDATEGLTEQDARIAGYAWERGRGLALVVNKWDAVPAAERDRKRFSEMIDARFPMFDMVPRVFISALTGEGVDRILGVVDMVASSHAARLQTARLNEVLQDAVARQAPPVTKGKRARFRYATQTATCPPTITIFGARAEHVLASYERYLVNQLREAFGLRGTPIRLRFRSREVRSRAPARPRNVAGRRRN